MNKKIINFIISFVLLFFIPVSINNFAGNSGNNLQKERIKKIIIEKQLQEALLYYPNKFPLHKNDILYISSLYGKRYHPIFKKILFHYGIDIVGFYNKPIIATAKGTILKTRYNKYHGYGNYIVIKHKYGYETIYAHLNKIYVKVGNTVNTGDTIGTLGNTGLSTGAHLHYEIRENNYPVDPQEFLGKQQIFLFANKK